MQKNFLLFILSIAYATGATEHDALFAAPFVDTVFITPAVPTTDDSLIFAFRGNNHCCCAEFLNKKVTVADSTISLFASYNDEHCQLCDCMTEGFSTAFSCPPIHAGKYKIVYSEDLYCPPGKVCAAIAFPQKTKKMGEIVVRNSAVSIGQDAKVKKNNRNSAHRVLSYSNAESKLILKIQRPQYVLVTAYIVNGEKSTQLSSKKYLQAGTHSFRMDKERFSSAVVVIHVKGEHFSEVQMINFAK